MLHVQHLLCVSEGTISMAKPYPFHLNVVKRKVVFDLSNTAQEDSPVGWNTFNRKIFIMRHGERVDTTFGTRWLDSCFDENGQYIQKDLNMPKVLPKRKNYRNWSQDPPLTNIGHHQAFLTGEAMQEAGINVSHVYCSPMYRCVETCTAFLKGEQNAH